MKKPTQSKVNHPREKGKEKEQGRGWGKELVLGRGEGLVRDWEGE